MKKKIEKPVVEKNETSETIRTLYRRKIEAPIVTRYDKIRDTGQQLLIKPLQLQLPLL